MADGQEAATPCHRGTSLCHHGTSSCGGTSRASCRGTNPPPDKTLPCFPQFSRLSPKPGLPHTTGEAGLGAVLLRGIIPRIIHGNRESHREAAWWHGDSEHICGDITCAGGLVVTTGSSYSSHSSSSSHPRPDPGRDSAFGVQGAPRSPEPAPRPGCTSRPGAHKQSQPVYSGGTVASATCCFPSSRSDSPSPEKPLRAVPRWAGPPAVTRVPPAWGHCPGQTGLAPAAPGPWCPPKVLGKSRFASGEAGWSGMRRMIWDFLPTANPRGF